jgi:LacI family transcriptional regulator
MPETRRAPTIADVARASGVAKSTVSRALNDSSRIGEPTKKRVRAAARRLGYEPNYIARSLTRKRTQTIGVILEDILNPFFSEVAKGIETALRRRGYTMLLTSSGYRAAEELELARTLLRNRVDGVLITPLAVDSPAMQLLQKRRVPFFILNEKSADPRLSWVDSDNLEGGALATEYLLRLGHRRFLSLSSNALHGTRDRFEGFRRAIEARGLRLEDQVVLRDANSQSDACGLVTEFVRAHGRQALPSAIVAVNDAAALGAMECLLTAGVRIPQEVSIIGYDDIYLAPFLRVPLTTVHQSKYKMGEIAASGLVEGIDRKADGQAHHFLIKPRLIVRESCQEHKP